MFSDLESAYFVCVATVCKSPIALPPYGKLTASSSPYKKGSSCLADDGYLMTNKAWCAKHNNGTLTLLHYVIDIYT